MAQNHDFTEIDPSPKGDLGMMLDGASTVEDADQSKTSMTHLHGSATCCSTHLSPELALSRPNVSEDVALSFNSTAQRRLHF